MSPNIATIDQLSRAFSVRKSPFSSGHIQALDNVSLQLGRGRTLAVVGESGCGKSTLARLLMKLDTPSAGSIKIEQDGNFKNIQDIPKREFYRRVQMVFQDPYSSLNPRKRIWQIVSSALSNLGTHTKNDMKRTAKRLMESVGLSNQYLDSFPNELSGGQRQRVCIARALAVQPEILVLDEPLSALDVSIQAQILNLLLELQQHQGLTYLFISHDLAVVRHIADEVAVMHAGKLVEYGPVDLVIDTPSHPYTWSLVTSSLHTFKGREQTLITDEASIVSENLLGCNFSWRCAQAVDQRLIQQARSDGIGVQYRCGFSSYPGTGL